MKGKHRSKAKHLIGNKCAHITRGSTDLRPCLTGNQCPHITRAATASIAIGLIEITFPIYQGQPQHKQLPVPE